MQVQHFQFYANANTSAEPDTAGASNAGFARSMSLPFVFITGTRKTELFNAGLFNAIFPYPLRLPLSPLLFHLSITSARVSPANTLVVTLASVTLELTPFSEGATPATTGPTTDSTVLCNTGLYNTVKCPRQSPRFHWV